MLKRMMIVILLSAISIAPIAPLAGVSSTAKINSAKINSNLKTVTRTPVILLAANDVTHLQDINAQTSDARNVSDKSAVSKETGNVLTDIPPQVWLIVAALFCFVMRSSRRVV